MEFAASRFLSAVPRFLALEYFGLCFGCLG